MHKRVRLILAAFLFVTVFISAIILTARVAFERHIQHENHIKLNEERTAWFDEYVVDSSDAYAVSWPQISTKDCLAYEGLSTQRNMPTDSTSLCIYPYMSTAKMNGHEIELKNVAIMRNGEIMLPVIEIVDLLGGRCLYSEETGELRIYLKSWNGKPIETGWGPQRLFIGISKYENGSGTGAREEAYKAGGRLSQNCLEEIDGILYVGASYLPDEIYMGWMECVDGIYYGREFSPTFKGSEEATEASAFIMTVIEEDFGINGIIVGETFNPEALGIQFHRKGLPIKIPFLQHTYTNEDITVRTRWDYTSNAEVVSEIILLSDKYCTPRGIRVGSFISEVSTTYQCDVCFANAILIEECGKAYIEMDVSTMVVEQIRIAAHDVMKGTSEPRTTRFL